MSSRLNWNGEEVPFGMLFAQTNDEDPLVLDGHYDPDRQIFVNRNGTPVFGGTLRETCRFYPTYLLIQDCRADYKPDY
jgi:hypothetical protein